MRYRQESFFVPESATIDLHCSQRNVLAITDVYTMKKLQPWQTFLTQSPSLPWEGRNAKLSLCEVRLSKSFVQHFTVNWKTIQASPAQAWKNNSFTNTVIFPASGNAIYACLVVGLVACKSWYISETSSLKHKIFKHWSLMRFRQEISVCTSLIEMFPCWECFSAQFSQFQHLFLFCVLRLWSFPLFNVFKVRG